MKRRKRSKKRLILFLITIIVSIIFFKYGQAYLKRINRANLKYSSPIQENIYNYLSGTDNRLKVYSRAAELNHGSTANTCVYFISEVLRENDYPVPSSVCNTTELISLLSDKGWIKDYDYKDLKPGDICFTTDSHSNIHGTPSHTYVFMAWVKKGSYDFAYVCDNQAKDYSGKIYHLRNIRIRSSANGQDKDPFSFFMYSQ